MTSKRPPRRDPRAEDDARPVVDDLSPRRAARSLSPQPERDVELGQSLARLAEIEAKRKRAEAYAESLAQRVVSMEAELRSLRDRTPTADLSLQVDLDTERRARRDAEAAWALECEALEARLAAAEDGLARAGAEQAVDRDREIATLRAALSESATTLEGELAAEREANGRDRADWERARERFEAERAELEVFLKEAREALARERAERAERDAAVELTLRLERERIARERGLREEAEEASQRLHERLTAVEGELAGARAHTDRDSTEIARLVAAIDSTQREQAEARDELRGWIERHDRLARTAREMLQAFEADEVRRRATLADMAHRLDATLGDSTAPSPRASIPPTAPPAQPGSGEPRTPPAEGSTQTPALPPEAPALDAAPVDEPQAVRADRETAQPPPLHPPSASDTRRELSDSQIPRRIPRRTQQGLPAARGAFGLSPPSDPPRAPTPETIEIEVE